MALCAATHLFSMQVCFLFRWFPVTWDITLSCPTIVNRSVKTYCVHWTQMPLQQCHDRNLLLFSTFWLLFLANMEGLSKVGCSLGLSLVCSSSVFHTGFANSFILRSADSSRETFLFLFTSSSFPSKTCSCVYLWSEILEMSSLFSGVWIRNSSHSPPTLPLRFGAFSPNSIWSPELGISQALQNCTFASMVSNLL